jgi:UDP-N-acetylmuramoyl-L-alanyl-D-glutamate--2,6-diaminopimelate ligase
VSEPSSILSALDAKGVKVRHLVSDSRRVRPGDVFVAVPGARLDGRDFITQAMNRGAAAVIAETGIKVDAGTTALIEVEGLAARLGELAHEVYGRPSEDLWLAGITGTNGKTSVSQWIAQASALLGQKCAVIGTLGNGFPEDLEDSPNTTPDPITLHRELSEFRAAGAMGCAMEVSSIGLDQERVSGAKFDVAVFTNLTRDHLEYHGSMDAYGAAKERLFHWADLKAAVINLDDPFGVRLSKRLASGVCSIGYSLNSASGDSGAREVLRAANFASTPSGIAFDLRDIRIEAPVVGRFNAANLLAVIGALLVRGERLEDIARVLRQLTPPPGRMQVVGGQNEPLLVIDYAHTPDALEKALGVLRETAAARGGKLICVFGCGGDRDPGKRAPMGAVAETLADHTLVTSDNPRSEDPQAIIEAILQGMNQASVEPDRAKAIVSAVRQAGQRDVILVAGKGHEPYQDIAGVKYPFSDIEAAKSALAGRRA